MLTTAVKKYISIEDGYKSTMFLMNYQNPWTDPLSMFNYFCQNQRWSTLSRP